MAAEAAEAEAPAPEKTLAEVAEEKKRQGNSAFQAKDFKTAIRLYGEAIDTVGEAAAPATYFSNRSVCHANLGDFAAARADAVLAMDRPDGCTKKVLFQKSRAELRLGMNDEAEQTLCIADQQGLRQEISGMLSAEGLAVPGLQPQPSRGADEAPRGNGKRAAADATETGEDAAAAAKAEGNAKYKEGNYREALVAWERSLNLLPPEETERRQAIMGNLAAASLMLRRWQDCVSWSNKVLEQDPNNMKIRARLAMATVANGDFLAAKRVLGDSDDPTLAASRQQLQDLENKFNQANEILASGEPGRALSVYSELESKAIFDSPALNIKMAWCYLELRNFPRVLNMTQQVLRADQGCVDAYVLRAEALYRNNDEGIDGAQFKEPLEMGQKLLKQALSLDPDHNGAQSLRKRLKTVADKVTNIKENMDSREFEKAREVVDGTLELIGASHPRLCAKLHCERARAGFRLKDFRQCIKDCGMATYKDHHLAPAYLLRAQAFQALERHEDAVKELEQLLQWKQERSVYEKLEEAKFILRKHKRVDYYQLMGVGQIASQLEIKKAYKERAAEWHPDKKGHLDEDARKNAEEMFKKIGEAYEVLTDATKKELYDKGYDLEGIQEQIELKKRKAQGHGHGHGHF